MASLLLRLLSISTLKLFIFLYRSLSVPILGWVQTALITMNASGSTCIHTGYNYANPLLFQAVNRQGNVDIVLIGEEEPHNLRKRF